MKRQWINVGVGLCCVLLLLALLLPAMVQVREDARRSQCKANLKQWGVALHNYHDTHMCFPPYAGGTNENGERLSGRVMLLPYLVSGPLWTEISRSPGQGGDPLTLSPRSLPEEIPLFLCPSSEVPRPVDRQPHANYVFCAGDQLDFRDEGGEDVMDFPNGKQTRGGFGWRHCVRMEEIADGGSHSIAMAERDLGQLHTPRDVRGHVATVPATSPADCVALASKGEFQSTVSLLPELMGERWASGHPIYSVFLTAVPPNGPSCAASAPPSGPSVGGWFTASSRHTGGNNDGGKQARGCHVLMFDGTVRFVNENINAGDQKATHPQPAQRFYWFGGDEGLWNPSSYGVWGALGTIKGYELRCSG